MTSALVPLYNVRQKKCHRVDNFDIAKHEVKSKNKDNLYLQLLLGSRYVHNLVKSVGIL